jgi:uncharacterized RDD family membrane protein YckC
MAKKTSKKEKKQNKIQQKPAIPFAGNAKRAKAFLTDIFMLLMPLLYFVIYVIMGSLEDASHEKLRAWGYALIPYLLILSIFMIKDKGRSPGMRSQALRVIDTETLDKPSIFSILFRNFSFLLTLVIPFVWMFPFFRKDHRTLHDYLSKTCVILDSNTPQNNKSS